jgi:hypothetical protein
MLHRIVYRVVMFVATAGVCVWLSSALRPWPAVGAWTVGIGAVCVVTALLLSRQPMGRIGFINRAAGLVLPWGFRIGKGRLWPAVLTSWLIWSAVGAAVIALASGGVGAGGATDGGSSSFVTLRVLLFLSWLIDGGALLYVVGVAIVNRSGSGGMKASLLKVTSFLAVVLIASMVLTFTGSGSAARLSLALAISCGPPLLFGAGYGVFLGVMLTAGRKARWN